jgi:hypothetical protein
MPDSPPSDSTPTNPPTNPDAADPNAEQFWRLADSFINLANELYKEQTDGKVGYAMLYAAARFNAFVVATTAGDKNTLSEEKQPAMEYFSEQYRKMIAENLEDYEKNFDKYI